MATEPTQYKVDQAVELLNSLNSGVIVKFVETKKENVNGELKDKRVYDNNLNPLISLLQTTNFNVVELEKIIDAASNLTDGIYHPKAEFEVGYDLRYNVIEQANEKIAEITSNLEVGQSIKLGVNDNYKDFIQANMNKAFRDNISSYANGILMNDAVEHMEFINKKGVKEGLSVDDIAAEQEKFMTGLKAGAFGLSAEEKYAKIGKEIKKYSLFTEGQMPKDPKTLAKDIAHSIDGFMDDLYVRRNERKVESEKLGLDVNSQQGYEYQRPRTKF